MTTRACESNLHRAHNSRWSRRYCRERPMSCYRPGRQTGSTALSRSPSGHSRIGVELVARSSTDQEGEDRKLFREAMEPSPHLPESATRTRCSSEELVGKMGFPWSFARASHSACRLVSRTTSRSFETSSRASALSPIAECLSRKASSVERVRDGGHARRQRQRGDRVLHRERRCDGHPHGTRSPSRRRRH